MQKGNVTYQQQSYIQLDRKALNNMTAIMRVDLSPRLGGHTVANQPPTTVLLSFTFILPPERCEVSPQVWNRVMN